MAQYKCSSPVLIIGFNRPDCVRAVVNCLRTVTPSEIYVAIDGPRESVPSDKERCKATQQVISEIDWECNVHKLFREENVGCGRGPSEAITWAFKSATRLIILEDDCIPSVSFFRFCDELLEKYADDKRVWIISGLSIHPNSKFFGGKDYLFSNYAHTWGWATWKSRWDEFDFDMKDVPQFIEEKCAFNVRPTTKMAERLNKRMKYVYDNIEEEKTHSWDTQWSYTRVKNGSRDVVPRLNLIQNIGADNGTHTTSDSCAANMCYEELPIKITHPSFVVVNTDYDKYHYSNYINSSFLGRVRKKIKSLFERIVK